MLDKIIDGFLQFGLPGVVLAACLVYIYWKDKCHREERIAVAEAQTEERKETRVLQKETMNNLLGAIENSNAVQRELTIAIYELRSDLSTVECVRIKRRESREKHDRLEKLS